MERLITKAKPKRQWMPLWVRETHDCWKGMDWTERLPLYGMMGSAIFAWASFFWYW